MMIPFFSEEGRMQAARILREGMLCAFDFDGTLSPFTGYENAHLPDDIRERLIRLQSMTPVAIVTGRALSDIRARLPFRPDYLVANHGQEGVPVRDRDSERYRRMVDCWHDALKKALSDTARYDQGIRLDNKRYSLAVHYRKVADYETAEDRLPRLFAEVVPQAHILPGKFVYNLIPPGAPDKGDALLSHMQAAGATTALYVGDDETDEDVFALDCSSILTVRVEKSVHSHARCYLESQDDVAALIDFVIDTLEASRRPGDPTPRERKPA